MSVCVYIYAVPPEYKLNSTFFEAEAGSSISVKFAVLTDAHSGKISSHALTKNGDRITTPYRFTKNALVFDKVALSDKGTYTISCRNDAGEGSARFELEVTPQKCIFLVEIYT